MRFETNWTRWGAADTLSVTAVGISWLKCGASDSFSVKHSNWLLCLLGGQLLDHIIFVKHSVEKRIRGSGASRKEEPGKLCTEGAKGDTRNLSWCPILRATNLVIRLEPWCCINKLWFPIVLLLLCDLHWRVSRSAPAMFPQSHSFQ